MNVLTSNSIESIVSQLREELSIYAGKGEDRRVLISPGNKLRDQDNINYTVTDVLIDEDGEILVKCIRAANPVVAPGENIEISLTAQELRDNFELV